MRLEGRHALQRFFEIAAEADRTIVHEDVRRRLAASHRRDIRQQAVIAQPAPHLRMVPGGEDNDVETAFREPLQKSDGARTRRIPMVGVLPPGVRIEHAIQIDADDGQARVLEIDLPGLPWHRDQIIIFVPLW